MSRISIDVTPQQHKRLKAMAALRGQTIKQFVLEKTLSAPTSKNDDDEAVKELEALLDQRLQEADSKGLSGRTVEDIFQGVYRETET